MGRTLTVVFSVYFVIIPNLVIGLRKGIFKNATVLTGLEPVDPADNVDYDIQRPPFGSFRLRADDGVTSRRPYNETRCMCNRIYDPVCASNDRSYFNLCQFQCAMAKANNKTVKIRHQGNCIPF